MKKGLDDLADKAKRMAAEGEWKEKIGDLLEGEEAEAVKEMAGELAEGAANFVRKYPLQSVFGAVAVGFLFGALVNRK